jgi:hypothetical protein
MIYTSPILVAMTAIQHIRFEVQSRIPYGCQEIAHSLDDVAAFTAQSHIIYQVTVCVDHPEQFRSLLEDLHGLLARGR